MAVLGCLSLLVYIALTRKTRPNGAADVPDRMAGLDEVRAPAAR